MHIHAIVERVRTYLAMIALLFAAVVISAPAAAQRMHGLSHAEAPVDIGEHHHHGDDGEVTTHGADHGSVPQPDDSPLGKFGHSHVASSALDVLPQHSRDLPALPVTHSQAPLPADTPALGTRGWSPKKRPPRTA